METNVRFVMTGEQEKLLRELAAGPGILVAWAPTGSGKTRMFERFAEPGSVRMHAHTAKEIKKASSIAKRRPVWLEVVGNDAFASLGRLRVLFVEHLDSDSTIRKIFRTVKGAVWWRSMATLCPECRVPAKIYMNDRGFVTENRLDDRVHPYDAHDVARLNDQILSFYESVEGRGLDAGKPFLPGKGCGRCRLGHDGFAVVSQIVDLRGSTADFADRDTFDELRSAWSGENMTVQEQATRLCAEGAIAPHMGAVVGSFSFDLGK